MNEDGYTAWFAYPYSKPEAIGVYEVRLPRYEFGQLVARGFAYWNGTRFTEPRQSPADAYNTLRGEVVGMFAWRGLTESLYHSAQ